VTAAVLALLVAKKGEPRRGLEVLARKESLENV
jgi:hypothetical protein